MEQTNIKTDIQNKISQYKSFLEVDPDNPELLINLGDLYHKISMFDDAVGCYEKSLKLTDSPIVKSRIGSVKISQHQVADAENIFKNMLNQESHPSLIYNLALTQYHQEKWEEALNNFLLAMKQGADQSGCLSYATRCYHQLSDIEHAKEYCNKWVEVSNTSTSNGYLALLEMDSGNKDKALELAYEVISSDPDNSDAAIVIGNSQIEEQDIEKAEKHFNSVLQKENTHPRALFGLGLTQLYQKDYDRAIELMENASRQMPNDTGVKIAIGWAKITKQDIEGAEQVFRDTIKIDRNFSEGHGGLAYALALKGKIDLAKEEMKTALWLDPTSFGAAASNSVIIGIEKGNDKAVEFLASTLEQSPVPGQKPMIEHIQTYMKKHSPKETPKSKN